MPIEAMLRDIIAQLFDLDELRNLCQDMDVDYDNLAGNTKLDKARSLTSYLNRRDELHRLLDRMMQLRPNYAWQEVQFNRQDMDAPLTQVDDVPGNRGAIASLWSDKALFDAYISYANSDSDTVWVWQLLVPRLVKEGLRVAVSGDIAQPGVANIVNAEQAVRQAKRTVIVISRAYLTDRMAEFENVLAQTIGIKENQTRLLPLKIESVDESLLPARLSMLTMLDFTLPGRTNRQFERLVKALQAG